jgi:hypothetical protein
LEVRRKWSAASVTTTASVNVNQRLRSAIVLTIDVAARPRTWTTSPSNNIARRTRIAARIETPVRGGTVTSIGSHGVTSMPKSQAAVKPEKTALSGSRSRTAAREDIGVCGKPAQTYIPRDMRRQFALRRCHLSSPASRASAIVNGPRVNAWGGAALRGMRASMAVGLATRQLSP